MEPLSVFRTIWRQKWFAIPAILLTIAAAVLVYVYGPREYESSVSYALVDPQVPTAQQLEDNPSLGLLNSDNPYLRSSDNSLIANVLVTRLNAPATEDRLKKEKLSTDYLAAPGDGGGSLIVTITSTGSSQRQSLATTGRLGDIFVADLRTIQKVNGADDRYLFTALVVDAPDRATEKLSSRLRTVIIVAIAGIILIFGAVSLGNGIDTGRRRRREKAEAEKRAAEEEAEAKRLEAERVESERRAAEEAEAERLRIASTPTATTPRKPRRPSQSRPPRPQTAVERSGDADVPSDTA